MPTVMEIILMEFLFLEKSIRFVNLALRYTHQENVPVTFTVLFIVLDLESDNAD
jgi:hypothetical protein